MSMFQPTATVHPSGGRHPAHRDAGVSTMAIAGWLGSCPLFSGADPRLIRSLAQSCEVRELARGTLLSRRAGEPDPLGVVALGKIRLMLPDTGAQDQGSLRARMVASLEAGESFGENALFIDNAVTLQVRTVEPSTLLLLPRSAMVPLIHHHPWLMQRMLIRLSQRMDAVLRDLAGYSRKRAASRVAQYLIDQAAAQSSGSLPPTARLQDAKRAIASRLSITPETLSRELRALREEKLVVESDGLFELLDPERLRLRALGEV